MNSAFEALRKVKDLPSELRTPSDDGPLFHQNDPMTIKGTHNDKASSRKPDVVLVSMLSASNAYEPGDQAVWTDYAFQTDPPRNNFGWNDILLTVEFKKRPDKDVAHPPPKYIVKAMKSIDPRSLDSTNERDELAEPVSGVYFDFIAFAKRIE
jgi:hypothetical protein